MRKTFGALALALTLAGCGGSSSSSPSYVTIDGVFYSKSIIVNGTDTPCPATIGEGDEALSCTDDSYLSLSSNGDFMIFDGTDTQRGDYLLTADGTFTTIDLDGDRQTGKLVQDSTGNEVRTTFTDGSSTVTFVFTKRLEG
ncbi:hypothetical protein EON81_00145 [bacterium]|nr:MAG: hypothetical protein EON81_00145 [bacterium]